MARMAILVLAGERDPDRVRAGLNVSRRINEARPENGIEEFEVYLFGDGVRLLGNLDPGLEEILRELRRSGVVVGACTNQLESLGLTDRARELDLRAEYARETLARYAREGFTVISF